MSCNQRIGLLVLGSFKLVFINLVGLGLQCNSLLAITAHFRPDDWRPFWNILAYPAAMVVFLVIDVTFSVILLIGSREKNRSLLRAYFWYAIAGVIVTVLLSGYSTLGNIFTIISDRPVIRDMILRDPGFYIGTVWFGLVNIVTEILLLVFARKELRKLQNDSAKTTEAHSKETELNNI